MEPPGGTSLSPRRCLVANPIFGFLINCLAVMNTRQAMRTNFWFDFLCFGCFGTILIGGKGCSNCVRMITCYISLNYSWLGVKLEENLRDVVLGFVNLRNLELD